MSNTTVTELKLNEMQDVAGGLKVAQYATLSSGTSTYTSGSVMPIAPSPTSSMQGDSLVTAGLLPPPTLRLV
ncbi:MAG: hypothetical protein U1E23_07635 [Reyranellaceae bacterium]